MPSDKKKLTNYVIELTAVQAALFGEKLAARGWTMGSAPYAAWKAQRDKTTVTAYNSGKCTIQGGGTEEVVQFILEPEVTFEARLGYEAAAASADDPSMFELHAGIDESGKGDFFGPLVIAAACTDEASAKALLAARVRDSKTVSGDAQILQLDALIKKTLGENRWSMVVVGNAAYNELYPKFANLNRLLAWGHARALENLLEKSPDCPRAISDRFGVGNLVRRALLERGKHIILDEHPKAEADIAVAAASIIARAEYVRRMRALSEQAGLELPKGCSARVSDTARELIKLKGRSALPLFVKMNFKTVEQL